VDTAVGQEGGGEPGFGDEVGDPAGDDEHLEPEGDRQAGGLQRAEGVADGQGGPQTPGDQHQVDHQDLGQPDQAEFFPDAGQ
jgi:hypothetical protein